MTRAQISQYLRDIESWQDRGLDDRARQAFCECMSHRHYGPNEAIDAWEWFLEGWKLGTTADH